MKKVADREAEEKAEALKKKVKKKYIPPPLNPKLTRSEDARLKCMMWDLYSEEEDEVDNDETAEPSKKPTKSKAK